MGGFCNIFYILSMCFFTLQSLHDITYNISPMIVTIPSEAGYAHQTPVILNKCDKRNAKGIRTINPRANDIICAYIDFSMERK